MPGFGIVLAWWELPPRARRIQQFCELPFFGQGTTSACAENTKRFLGLLGFTWNYLRVRGEYSTQKPTSHFSWELPPRARRIRLQAFFCLIKAGTTSACAENTNPPPRHTRSRRNYLRVRGEYASPDPRDQNAAELPPRARRILPTGDNAEAQSGTTSACAENTDSPVPFTSTIWNYLRVRGEYSVLWPLPDAFLELPPRARRIRLPRLVPRLEKGTTSACAENTARPGGVRSLPGNYLRVRGEYPK